MCVYPPYLHKLSRLVLTHIMCISQHWSLQCSLVCDNKLAAILKNEHVMKLDVYHASSHSVFGEPIFSNCPLLSCEISSPPYHLNRSALKCEGVSTSIAYRPSLFFLCCYSMQRSTTATHHSCSVSSGTVNIIKLY